MTGWTWCPECFGDLEVGGVCERCDGPSSAVALAGALDTWAPGEPYRPDVLDADEVQALLHRLRVAS